MLKNVRAKVGAALLLPVVAMSNSFAAVDAAVTTAISDGTADGKTIAYGILALSIVLGVIALVRRKA